MGNKTSIRCRDFRVLAEDGFQRQARVEVLCSEPFAVIKRRLVFVPRVAEKRDECLASAMVLLAETDSTGDVDPAGKSRGKRPSSRRSLR